MVRFLLRFTLILAWAAPIYAHRMSCHDDFKMKVAAQESTGGSVQQVSGRAMDAVMSNWRPADQQVLTPRPRATA